MRDVYLYPHFAMTYERRQGVLKRLARCVYRTSIRLTMAFLLAVRAAVVAVRTVLHFVALPFGLHVRYRPSELAKLTRRTAGFALDVVCICIPVLVAIWRWA
jgi:hypothetical protein